MLFRAFYFFGLVFLLWVGRSLCFVGLFVLLIENFTSLAILSTFQTKWSLEARRNILKVKFGLSRRKYFVPLFHEGFFSWFFLLLCHHGLSKTPGCVCKKKHQCSFLQMSYVRFLEEGINYVKGNNLFRLKLPGWTQEKLK